MPPSATRPKCTEHVLSIQPTYDELKSFQAFHVELLIPEALWPPPVMSYLHRWMHRHSLYNICLSRTRSLSELTNTLVLLTELPTTDDIKEKVAKKCASLVTQSALKWEKEGLLLQRGYGLGKRALLRDVWATYVGDFDEAETTILGDISKGGLGNDDDHGGSKKRETNTCLSQDIAKKPRTGLQRAPDKGVRGPVTREGKILGSEPDSCIIVGVGESSLAELGLAECPSPCSLDAIGAEISPHSSLDCSINTPFPPRPPRESSDEQVVHTVHENISTPNCVDNKGQVSVASRDTLSLRPPSPCDAADVPDMSHDQTQQDEGDGISDQRPSTIAGDTTSHNAVVPRQSTTLNPSSPTPDSTLARQTTTIAINGPMPLQPLTEGPICIQSDLPGPAIQASEQVQKHLPRNTATPASSATGVDMQAQSSSASPLSAHSRGFALEAGKHVKYIRPRNCTTLEPKVTTGPPATMAPSLHRSSPYQASRHMLPRKAGALEPRSRSISESDMQVGLRDNVPPTIAARDDPSTTPSRMFQSIGRILASDYNRPGTWSLLHVDTLMSRNVEEFYDYFSQHLQAGRRFAALTFGLLDSATDLASESSYLSTCISGGDHSSFQTMKRSIFCHFETSIAKNPALPMFRIVVAPPEIELTSLYRSESGGDGPEGRGASGNSLPQAKLLGMGSNPNQVALGPFKSCHCPQGAFSKPLSTVPAPSHNENLLAEGVGGHLAITQARESHSFYPACVIRGPRQSKAVNSATPPPLPAVVVRIQVNGHGGVSVPYPKTVLAPRVKNAEFFAWFANQTGLSGPTGPTELMFSFKDVVPTPKNNVITRGNDEHFEYMKRDIKPMCELAAANMPGLSEFAILVTVPGWVEETQDETW